MTDLFLIAHKVRDESAFDVAHQMECPECHGGTRDAVSSECSECDSEGYWWIIPTSGHRAYPYWSKVLDKIMVKPHIVLEAMPPNLPDHYPTRAAPTISLIDALGLRKPKARVENTPTQPIARRF